MRRRSFLKTTLAASAAVGFPTLVPARALSSRRAGRLGANDRIRVGFIGVGGRARGIMTGEWVSDGEIVAVADCYFPRCGEAAAKVAGGDRWATYAHHRAMLDKEKLDAVFVETTTHARVLCCLDALQAGSDVYGEKPLTLAIDEGRALVQAVRKLGRVFQTGTQQRSMPINQFASRQVREGAIGRATEVVACNFWPPYPWIPRAPRPIPAGLDWDLWCNQTELRPYHSEVQFGWAKYAEYDGGGQSWGVTGWGTHSLDQVQCALGTDDTGPVEIAPDDASPASPVALRYANGTVLKLSGPKRGIEDLGAIFVGENGRIEIRRGSAVADPPELLQGAPPNSLCNQPGEAIAHVQNFFDCVRSRQRPNADVEAGHRATTVCHLINIARALGRRLYWDPATERFTGDEEADSLRSRPRRAGYELPSLG
jgi:predicted dehydrogenase